MFPREFIQRLSEILINGNYGDIVMNPESLDIIEYFRGLNSKLHIPISTNGAARDKQFWQRLAELDTKIYFCLDGLEDTHSCLLYTSPSPRDRQKSRMPSSA